MNFTIGADPEFFLKNHDGGFISAVGKIGGSKTHPQLIGDKGHAILEDNVAVEFNIPPSNTKSEFINHLNFVLSHLDIRAKELGLVFAENIASASFPVSELLTPEACIFGCEPDYNAWNNGEKNPSPMVEDMTLRSAGGHVHVGTTLDKLEVIKAMDLFLGVPAMFIDKDTRRRDLYGKAGAHRPKPYGVEYRTLSNFWIWHDEKKSWVFDQTQKALEFVESGKTIDEKLGNMIQAAINTGDMNAANAVVRAYV